MDQPRGWLCLPGNARRRAQVGRHSLGEGEGCVERPQMKWIWKWSLRQGVPLGGRSVLLKGAACLGGHSSFPSDCASPSLQGLLPPSPTRAVHFLSALRSCLHTSRDLELSSPQLVQLRPCDTAWWTPPPGWHGSHFNSHPTLGNPPPPPTVVLPLPSGGSSLAGTPSPPSSSSCLYTTRQLILQHDPLRCLRPTAPLHPHDLPSSGFVWPFS